MDRPENTGFSSIKVFPNSADLKHSPCDLVLPNGERIHAYVPLGFEANGGPVFAPRNLKVTVTHLERQGEAVETALMNVVTQGRLTRELVPYHTSMPGYTRGIRFLDLKTNWVYTISGVGMGRAKGSVVVYEIPNVLNDQDISQWIKENDQAPNAEMRIEKHGNVTKIPSRDPMGAYFVDQMLEKIAATKKVAALGMHAVIPKVIAWGKYDDLSFRGREVGFFIYKTPLAIFPSRISALTLLVQDYVYAQGREDLMQNINLFHMWAYRTAQCIAAMARFDLVHNQLHPGNTGLICDPEQKNRPLITDMGTLQGIKEHEERRKIESLLLKNAEKRTPRQEAQICNLAVFMCETLKHSLMDRGRKGEEECLCRLLSYIAEGINSRGFNTPSASGLADRERCYKKILDKSDLAKKYFKERLWYFLAYFFANDMILNLDD
jgi:hypothetical protein